MADTTPTIKVPGLATADSMPVGMNQTAAVFVKGLEIFASLMGGEVILEAADGSTLRGTVLGSKPGRLFALSQEFMGQTPAAIAGAGMAGGYAFQDVAHFNALIAAYGKTSVGPLEPYTVISVRPQNTGNMPVAGVATPMPTVGSTT